MSTAAGTHTRGTDVPGRVPAARPRITRYTHPVAWWSWALGLLAAASRTTSAVLLGMILLVLSLVVMMRRPAAPWARAFNASLRLGAIVLVTRTLLQVIVNAPTGSHVAFVLPSLDLPGWMAGVRVGGLVTWESLMVGVSEGLRLATMIACVGAANSLAAPSRLLRSVPAALYEIGVAVVVALTYAPNLLADASRVAAARRLRGHQEGRLRAFGHSAGPVLEGGLDRSVDLAAAMDARGYGRMGPISRRNRRTHTGLLLAGCVGALVGCYGLLDAAAPRLLGWPLLAAGAVCAVAGLRLAGSRSIRTSYRPDPWLAPEWVTAGCGLLVAATFIWLTAVPGAGRSLHSVPLTVPMVPLAAVAVLLIAALPAIATPAPPDLSGGPL